MDLEEYKNQGIAARKNIDINQIKVIGEGILNSFKNNGKF